MSTLTTYPFLSTGLWDECSEWVWLPIDLYPDREKAITAAFHGLDHLPTGFRECGIEYRNELGAKIVYARPGEEHERGWAGTGEEMWWRCERDHPGAVKFWEIGPR